MVLAERQSELLRNGRRSRGPSPNGYNATPPDTSSDDDNSSLKRNGKSKIKQSEYEEKIRVGRDYQAVCPELVPSNERKPELLNDRALLVWSPTREIPDIKLEEYIAVAKERYGYNGEQALGMLFWHKHDLERAVMDLANFTPFPDEWTIEDKVLFEQAFQFHGKSFHRIRQMLPDKSIASLVKYYYSWKKTRHRQSVMDRQEKLKAGSKDGSENGSDNGSNDDSDMEDKVQLNKQNISALKRKISESSDDLRPTDSSYRINSRWTQEELSMAVIGVKKYGKDFQAIADTLGTKTEAHIRTFFVNYRRRYNLDNILKEHDDERHAAGGGGHDIINDEMNSKLDKHGIEMKSKSTNTISLIKNDGRSQEEIEKTKQTSNNKITVDIIEIDGTTTATIDISAIPSPTTIPTNTTTTPPVIITAATTTSNTTTTNTIQMTNSDTKNPVKQIQDDKQDINKSESIATADLTLTPITNGAAVSENIEKNATRPVVVAQQQQQQSPPKTTPAPKPYIKDCETVIMEIDLDSETSETSSPPKKLQTISSTTPTTTTTLSSPVPINKELIQTATTV